VYIINGERKEKFFISLALYTNEQENDYLQCGREEDGVYKATVSKWDSKLPALCDWRLTKLGTTSKF
jgi:hypothetical protein